MLFTLDGLRVVFVQSNRVVDAVLRLVGPMPGLDDLELLAVGVAALGSQRLSSGFRSSTVALRAAVWTYAAAYHG